MDLVYFIFQWHVIDINIQMNKIHFYSYKEVNIMNDKMFGVIFSFGKYSFDFYAIIKKTQLDAFKK